MRQLTILLPLLIVYDGNSISWKVASYSSQDCNEVCQSIGKNCDFGDYVHGFTDLKQADEYLGIDCNSYGYMTPDFSEGPILLAGDCIDPKIITPTCQGTVGFGHRICRCVPGIINY